jgi:hypothetical protein
LATTTILLPSYYPAVKFIPENDFDSFDGGSGGNGGGGGDGGDSGGIGTREETVWRVATCSGFVAARATHSSTKPVTTMALPPPPPSSPPPRQTWFNMKLKNLRLP